MYPDGIGPAAGGVKADQMRLPQSASDPRRAGAIRKYAQEFEASLLAAWWKEMQSSFAGLSDEEHGPEFETMNDLGAQALASGLAARGGIGIASLLVRNLLPRETPPGPARSGGAH